MPPRREELGADIADSWGEFIPPISIIRAHGEPNREQHGAFPVSCTTGMPAITGSAPLAIAHGCPIGRLCHFEVVTRRLALVFWQKQEVRSTCAARVSEILTPNDSVENPSWWAATELLLVCAFGVNYWPATRFASEGYLCWATGL
jgi:hypothetical protein